LRGVSSRIRVRSIVGRSSSTAAFSISKTAVGPISISVAPTGWQRNLYACVEVLFPVKDPQLRERICNESSPPICPTLARPPARAAGGYARPRSVQTATAFPRRLPHQLAQTGGLPLNGNGSRRHAPTWRKSSALQPRRPPHLRLLRPRSFHHAQHPFHRLIAAFCRFTLALLEIPLHGTIDRFRRNVFVLTIRLSRIGKKKKPF